MRITALMAAFLVVLVSPAAWSLCPNCLGQSPEISPTLKLVGVFLLLPPALFFAVAMTIRKLGGQSPPRAGSGDQAG